MSKILKITVQEIGEVIVEYEDRFAYMTVSEAKASEDVRIRSAIAHLWPVR